MCALYAGATSWSSFLSSQLTSSFFFSPIRLLCGPGVFGRASGRLGRSAFLFRLFSFLSRSLFFHPYRRVLNALDRLQLQLVQEAKEEENCLSLCFPRRPQRERERERGNRQTDRRSLVFNLTEEEEERVFQLCPSVFLSLGRVERKKTCLSRVCIQL